MSEYVNKQRHNIQEVHMSYSQINVREYWRGNTKMNNSEKLATQAAQDEENRDNTICVGYYYAKANTNNVSKTWALLQTTGGKDVVLLIF